MRSLLLLLLVLVLPTAWADDIGGGLKSDVRLLIDISGSMKQSDPENLRIPALELIIRLLPEGSRAGVWTFGESVQVLVPHGPVDALWRESARAAISAIDNSGQRTNIPAALAAATYDIGSMDPRYRSSIVLLTDGKVDVSTSPMANASAARSLLTTTAPELGATGIPVHTIALSDEADWEFLQDLARSTSGIAERALSAADLTEIYLQSLEMAAPMARVPVQHSAFDIDASVREFTALVFFEAGDEQLALVSPSGERFDPTQADGPVQWYRNDQFALITVADPAAGNWQLEVAEAARVRVTVISDLQLDVDPLPNNMPSGKVSELGIRLRDRGATIVDPEVLALFDLQVQISGPGDYRDNIVVTERYELPATGEYRVAIPAFTQAGRYQLLVQLRGETLARELPLYVEVSASPAAPSIRTRPEQLPEDDLTRHALTLGAAAVVLIALVIYIRRRRHQRRLALWQRRARDSASGDDGLLDGVSADSSDTQSPG